MWMCGKPLELEHPCLGVSVDLGHAQSVGWAWTRELCVWMAMVWMAMVWTRGLCVWMAMVWTRELCVWMADKPLEHISAQLIAVPLSPGDLVSVLVRGTFC